MDRTEQVSGVRVIRAGGRGRDVRAEHRERGQGMTEYLILVVLVGLVCIPLVRMLPAAVYGYLRPFYYCVSRPVP